MQLPREITAESLPEVEGSDARPGQEESSFSDEQYQSLQKSRRSIFKMHVHWVSILLLYAFTIFYMVAGVTWLWHLIFPESWHYMPQDNYDTLQSVLFGTIIGGLASQFARRVFADD